LGGGAVIDSGAVDTVTLAGANFSGVISGSQSLVFNGAAALSGLEDYSGGATLDGSATVANAGTYDIISNNGISGTSGSLFVNNGLFEKTSAGGVSNVTSNFINSGALNVLSGSVKFSGGFTNNGVIHGLVTQSGGVTAISAAVPSDFNGDSHSDILWQNANGQAAIWNMNGSALIGGGTVSPNPGPAWKAVGTGDFDDDHQSDILWQNASTGQVSIWEMSDNHLVGGGAVSSNPGPSWKAIGAGDFNGDDHSDVLFQNTSSGQVSIWEMNGKTLIGGGAVSPNPGPSWRAVGTGDFNGDGLSDVLFQNTNTAGGAGGSNPGGRLLVDASGNLFGTTLSGGAHNAGTVFEIKNTGGSYAASPTVLTSFNSGITPSGSGNLVADAAGRPFRYNHQLGLRD
jgi:uncharacterized repeat protein (TIGR03803 family)